MGSNITIFETAENAKKIYLVTNYWSVGNLSTYDSTTSSWYSDAEKLKDGYGVDEFLCWAAAASNVIQAQGWNRIFANEDRSLDYFMNTWSVMGGYSETAFSWWITGQDKTKDSVTPSGGNFYTLSDSALTVLVRKDAAAEASYGIISYFSVDELKATKEQQVGAQFFSKICNALESGYCLSLGISIEGDGGHAITCWGYEIDDKNWYLYISDSDDNNDTATVDRRTAKNTLHKYQVVIDEKGRLSLTKEYAEKIYQIVEFSGLAAYDPVYEGISETIENAEMLSLASNKAGKSATSSNGTIALAEDLDYYYFESPVNGIVTVKLSAARSGGTCNLKVSLLDKEGTVLETKTGASPTITANVTENQYYILVEGNGQAITMLDAPYTLDLSMDAGDKPDLTLLANTIVNDRFVVNSRNITQTDVITLYQKPLKVKNKAAFYADETLYVFCGLGNIGVAESASYTVQAYVDETLTATVTASGGAFLEEVRCLNLGKLSAGKHQITVKLNADQSVPEIRYANNTYSYTITVKTAKNHTCGSDFNGNSISDITLVHKDGVVGAWMDADSSKWKNSGTLDLSAWAVAGSGDFKQDGKDDLLLYQKENGILGYWNDGDSSQWVTVGTAGSGWEVLGVVDANHKGGRNDIILKNDNYIYAWLDGSSESGKLISSKATNPDIWAKECQCSASGDVDGDGYDELLFMAASGKELLYVSTVGESYEPYTWSYESSLVAAGDFNHDEFDDLLFSSASEDGNEICVHDSFTGKDTTLITLSSDWKILGARDYNNDSYCDILLENTAMGIAGYWHGCASGLNVSEFTVAGNGLTTDWKMVC